MKDLIKINIRIDKKQNLYTEKISIIAIVVLFIINYCSFNFLHPFCITH